MGLHRILSTYYVFIKFKIIELGKIVLKGPSEDPGAVKVKISFAVQFEGDGRMAGTRVLHILQNI